MNNDFLNPENENKRYEPAENSSEEYFAYNEISDDVDIFGNSPVVTEGSEDAFLDADETADVFDRPVCTNPDPAESYTPASETSKVSEITTAPETADISETAPAPAKESDEAHESYVVCDSSEDNFVFEDADFTLSEPGIPEYNPEPASVSAVSEPVLSQPQMKIPTAEMPQATPKTTPMYNSQYTPTAVPSQQYYTPSVNPVVPAQPVQPATPVTQPSYYPTAATTEHTTVPVKPKKGGSTAFLIVLWVLVGLFAVGFFGLCGYIIGNSNKGNTDTTRPTLFQEDTTEPETIEPDEDSENKSEASLPDAKPMPDDDNLYSDSTSLDLKAPPADKNNSAKYTTQYAYKKVATSTIGVVCYDKGFSDEPASEGTGIILTEDGYIATNSHVIGDSRSLYSVQVVTHDGEKYSAKVIGYDSRTDIAVLKIDAENLTPAEFCNSEYIEVGQDVIAVGNPGGMGFQNSLTRGVVSALDRELELSSQVSYIQTDAAINPGNSGGPLCNMYGQVIGINTAKISSSSYEGMGFAIPSALVKEIADDLIAHGYVNGRVRLGISGQAVSPSMMQYFEIPTGGILVGEIVEGGPCDNSGLQMNDVITAIDDDKVESFSDIYGILAEHQPGDKVVLHVYRTTTGKELEITVTLMADEGETQQ